ncbi:hypothetical protein N0O92_09050 [Alkalihalobacillus sp. MEB130]|uniref:hypothetical protein n=1 Tax=Alkalihalobacillus sp. MEB130 TaxID=2976704 RepID=UPI0028DF4B10|nr:hypothetical protein [Alkalihalobacillus sp. MEB130]MDT8860380.1 hypothetical protein [Alkalihalobacillus sp. MEB130]
MEKVKTHPFILIALLASSISMALYAYRNFSNQEIGFGVTFTLLSLFLIGLTISGFKRNRKIDAELERSGHFKER